MMRKSVYADFLIYICVIKGWIFAIIKVIMGWTN